MRSIRLSTVWVVQSANTSRGQRYAAPREVGPWDQ